MGPMVLRKPGVKRGGRNSKGQHTVARAISSRLRQFWDGDWDAMLREVTEAAAAGRPRRRTPTIEDEARRIRGLMDIGELRRATAQVTDPAQIAEGGGVATKLKEMFPGGRRYQPPTLEPGTAEHQARNTEPQGLRGAMVSAVEHAPRRLAPGLGGSRYERWRLLTKIPGGTDHFANLAIDMVMGRTPKVMEAISRG